MLFRSKLTEDEVKSLNRISAHVGLKMIEDLMETLEKYRSASNILSYFEIGLLKLIGHRLTGVETPKEKFVERVEKGNSKIQEVVEQEDPEPALVEEKTEEVKLTTKPKENKKKKVQIVQNRDFSLDFLVQLFVSGDRAKRLEVERSWLNVRDYQSDLTYGKIANLLIDTRLVALNEGFMLVSHSEEYIINELNMDDNQVLIEDFTGRVWGIRMRAYAILHSKSEEAKQYFLQLRNENKLPEPIEPVIQRNIVEEKVGSVEKNLFDLFGQENVEIFS